MDDITITLPRSRVQWLVNHLATTPLPYAEVHPVLQELIAKMQPPTAPLKVVDTEDDAAP